MTEAVVVRPATPGDAAPIAQIHVAAWQVAYDGLVPAEVLAGQSVERRHAWWATRFASPPERGLRTDVAVTDDHVIGFCATGPSRDDDAEMTVGEVHAIYVSPSLGCRCRLGAAHCGRAAPARRARLHPGNVVDPARQSSHPRLVRTARLAR